MHAQQSKERAAMYDDHAKCQWARGKRDMVRFSVLLAACALLGLIGPTTATAAGSRAAVEAAPGEIAVLRAVPARHAARATPPGRALLVDPSPKSEVDSGLSHLEIASDSYGRVAAGGHGASPGGVAGHMSSFMTPLGAQPTSGQVSAPKAAGGAMGAATGSIGAHVTGALTGAGLMGQGGANK